MGSDKTGGVVVTRRANRFVTTGCLTILIASSVVLGIVVSWLWYRHWHDGNVNSERSDKAFALIRKQARATADDTARALDTSGSTPGTGARLPSLRRRSSPGCWACMRRG